MKILKKLFLSVGILIFTFIIIFNQNIPAFIYNELEWRERAAYLLTEELLKQVEYFIDIRTGKEEVFISDEVKFNQLIEEIDKRLEATLSLADEYSALLNRQDRIPFLSLKYEKYQELKKPAFDNYRKGLTLFKEVKDKEHRAFRLMVQVDAANQKLATAKFEEMTAASQVAEELIKQAEQLYQEKVIDEGFRAYAELECRKIIDFYKIIVDPKNATDNRAIAKELEAIGKKGAEIDFNQIVTDWHKNILDDLNTQKGKYSALALEQMMEADKYYRENDLKNDLISKLLSKFSKKYPKNI